MPPETLQHGRTVLVVEDDVDTRATLRLALEDEGFTVESSGDGLHALEKLRHQTPDVIILDLSMPRMGGQDFLSAWRTGIDTPVVPVIVISAAFNAPRTEDLGVDAFVPKPFDLPALVQHVKRLVGSSPRGAAAGRDDRTTELRAVTGDLADQLRAVLTDVASLAASANLSADLRPAATSALESARRGSTLARRLEYLVSTLE